jgi:hypothetical protein
MSHQNIVDCQGLSVSVHVEHVAATGSSVDADGVNIAGAVDSINKYMTQVLHYGNKWSCILDALSIGMYSYLCVRVCVCVCVCVTSVPSLCPFSPLTSLPSHLSRL